MTNAPLFSVIIATRNRPQLFARALASVLAQDYSDFDVHIVMDGGDAEHGAAYDAVYADAAKPLHIHKLIHRENGHGQSYSLNHGVQCAMGNYVTFLDDDDEWTDPQHLSRASHAITAAKTQGFDPDYIMANQKAALNGVIKEDPVWLEDLEDQLVSLGVQPFADTFYRIKIEQLLKATGFCHLNTSIISRGLYERVGGMDEGLRWECDHDLFLRLIESANACVFIPNIVSLHHIPDPDAQASMTTRLSMVQKRLYQSQMLQKNITLTRSDAIRAHCQMALNYALKKLALELVEVGQTDAADLFAALSQKASFRPSWPVEYSAKKIKQRMGSS